MMTLCMVLPGVLSLAFAVPAGTRALQGLFVVKNTRWRTRNNEN
jgi:hypothetical protein